MVGANHKKGKEFHMKQIKKRILTFLTLLCLCLLPASNVFAYTFEDYEDVNENGIFVDRHVESDTLTSTVTVLLYTQSSGRNLMNFENSICFWYYGATEESDEHLGIQLRLRPWNFKTNDPFMDGSLWTVSGRIENGYYNFHIRDTICAKAQLGLVGILTENFEEPFTHQVDTPVLTKVENEDIVLYGIYAQDYEWYTEHVDEFIAWAKQHEKERLEKQLTMAIEYAKVNGEDYSDMQESLDTLRTIGEEIEEKTPSTPEEIGEEVEEVEEPKPTNEETFAPVEQEEVVEEKTDLLPLLRVALIGIGLFVAIFFISKIAKKYLS